MSDASPSVTARDREIGWRLKMRRESLGLAVRDLSGPGVSYAHISAIENGKRRPTVEALRKLAPLLGVSVHWLETGEPDPVEVAGEVVETVCEIALALLDLAIDSTRTSVASTRLLVGVTAEREETT